MMSHLARMSRTCFPSIGRVSSLARRFSSTSDQSNGRMFEPSWKLGSDFFAKTWGLVTRPMAETMRDLMMSSLDSVPVPSKKGVFTIADYGTNDGYASMPLFTTIIEKLRAKHGEELAIQVIYEDQERNDFDALFNRLYESESEMSDGNDIQQTQDDILDSTITESEVREAIKKLRSNKAAGPDGIVNELLKTIVNQIAPFLTILFNNLLTTATFPNEWAKAIIQHTHPSNIRLCRNV
ncbi:hypothetical protein BaRGS_00011794 [Batillaria attramentaria]|uniref:Uncharacterized protein n=1 Tax=Batillaria attramentaria TaxID=370345 RepID=A0ABD0LCS6_9CAEN